MEWSLPLTGEIGAWTIHLNYTSKRDCQDAQELRLWKGTLAITRPVNIRMKRHGPNDPLPSRSPPAPTEDSESALGFLENLDLVAPAAGFKTDIFSVSAD